jgi:hypothetical protein
VSNAICVLGMMRTGTSVVAGILDLLGVRFGPPEYLLEPNVANPAGFWEHKGIIALNDELLRRLGGTWYEPPSPPLGWQERPDLDDLRARATALLETDLAPHDVWAWKDPRTCLTLPFWLALVPDLVPVLCLRRPADAARSLATMGWAVVDSLDEPHETARNLWLRYTSDALEHTRGRARLLVFHERLLEDPGRQSERLAAFTGLSERVTRAARHEIEEFVRPAERSHIEATDPRPRGHPADELYAELEAGE